MRVVRLAPYNPEVIFFDRWRVQYAPAYGWRELLSDVLASAAGKTPSSGHRWPTDKSSAGGAPTREGGDDRPDQHAQDAPAEVSTPPADLPCHTCGAPMIECIKRWGPCCGRCLHGGDPPDELSAGVGTGLTSLLDPPPTGAPEGPTSGAPSRSEEDE